MSIATIRLIFASIVGTIAVATISILLTLECNRRCNCPAIEILPPSPQAVQAMSHEAYIRDTLKLMRDGKVHHEKTMAEKLAAVYDRLAALEDENRRMRNFSVTVENDK